MVWAALLTAALAACSRSQVREAGTASASSAPAAGTAAPAAAPGGAPAAPAPAGMQPAAASPAGAGQAPGAALGDTLWVDVRTPQEYAAGHVARAVNIPFDQMETRWTELESHRGGTVVLYCHSGRRAGIALQVLQAHGFAKATNGGGLEALRQAGEPVTQ